MKKKILAYFLTLVMVFSLMPVTAFSKEAVNPKQPVNPSRTYLASDPGNSVPIGEENAEDEGTNGNVGNGLKSLKFNDYVYRFPSESQQVMTYVMTPAFDPAVKEYTVQVPDSKREIFAWATRDASLSSSATIEAEWTYLRDNTKRTGTITSGHDFGTSLLGAVGCDEVGNRVTITVTDGDFTDVYTVDILRTDPTLEELRLGSVELDKAFNPSVMEYSASTSDESVTVIATPRSDSYAVTVNGGSGNTVPLELGENVIEVAVQFPDGEKNTYTIRVFRTKQIDVTLDVTPSDAEVKLSDPNGNLLTPNAEGVYQLLAGVEYSYTAIRSGYISKRDTFTLTESGSYKIELSKSTAEPVTVYFSFSDDDRFEQCGETGEIIALKEITVPYFDLADYGLERFYFRSEHYGSGEQESGTTEGSSGARSDLKPGTAESAYGKITMLHLFIYATEVYYCGIDPEDAGQGYLYKAGILGSQKEHKEGEVLNITGDAGSSWMESIWGHDQNLNYYLNYEYPRASTGWGSTSDQILIHDGDIVTLGHFSSYDFFKDPDSIFNYITADNTAPAQGDQITLSVMRAGADGSGKYTTGHYPVTAKPEIYCARVDDVYSGNVRDWEYVGSADGEGKLTVDTGSLTPGEYIFAIAGRKGTEYTDVICSTPGGVRVTVQAKPAIKGDVNGDGVVTVVDVTALFNAISESRSADPAVADFNGDGEITVADVMAIYTFIQSGD